LKKSEIFFFWGWRTNKSQKCTTNVFIHDSWGKWELL
jgi:hypothetical protein